MTICVDIVPWYVLYSRTLLEVPDDAMRHQNKACKDIIFIPITCWDALRGKKAASGTKNRIVTGPNYLLKGNILNMNDLCDVNNRPFYLVRVVFVSAMKRIRQIGMESRIGHGQWQTDRSTERPTERWTNRRTNWSTDGHIRILLHRCMPQLKILNAVAKTPPWTKCRRVSIVSSIQKSVTTISIEEFFH